MAYWKSKDVFTATPPTAFYSEIKPPLKYLYDIKPFQTLQTSPSFKPVLALYTVLWSTVRRMLQLFTLFFPQSNATVANFDEFSPKMEVVLPSNYVKLQVSQVLLIRKSLFV